jgi:type IV secretory pathway VirB10-like protein
MSTDIAEVETIRAEVAPVVERAASMVIVTPNDYAAAGEVCKSVNRMIRVVGERFDPAVDQAYQAHRAATALRASFLDPLKSAKKIISDKQLVWSREQEAIRLKEQARLQAEADERARKEREKAEAAARLQREREAQAQRDAEEARKRAAAATNEAERRKAQAEAERRQAEANAAAAKAEAREEAAAAVVAPVVTVASTAPVVKGQSIRKTWKAVVVDAALVPREWLVVNDQALQAFAKATKGACPVAGVTFIEETGLSSSSK